MSDSLIIITLHFDQAVTVLAANPSRAFGEAPLSILTSRTRVQIQNLARLGGELFRAARSVRRAATEPPDNLSLRHRVGDLLQPRSLAFNPSTCARERSNVSPYHRLLEPGPE